VKGEFLTILRVEDYNGGREWLLTEPLVYRTSEGGMITAPASVGLEPDDLSFWTWNGASIPRFFWRVFGSPFCGKHRRPSVLHDYLWMMAGKYTEVTGMSSSQDRILQSKFTFRYANWVFYDAMIACGERRWVAWLKWLGTAFKASFQKGGWR
jgi:hypothetical protein